MNKNWAGIVFGVPLILDGTCMLVTGQGGQYWDFPVPARAGWVFLSVGIIAIGLSISGLRRPARKEPLYSDQEVERTKAALDRMYLQERGTLPKEEPPKEEAPHSKKVAMVCYWLGIVLGVVFIAYGMRVLSTNTRGNYWSSFPPSRAGAGLALLGIFIIAASIRELWLGRKKKPLSSRQKAERAKAALASVPLPKHHSPLTEKTHEEAPEATSKATPKDEAARREDSSR